MEFRDRRSISQLSVVAMGAILIILVTFGAYIATSMSNLPNTGVTTEAGTTRLGTTSTNGSYTSTGIGSSITVNSSSTFSGSIAKETFNYATMPKVFRIGDYSFAMIYNGTYYVTSQNGTATANLGFNFVLNVTSLQTGNWETQDFGWAPPVPQPYTLPTPQNANLFAGAVQMNWNYNTTGISGTFLTISVLSSGGSVSTPSTASAPCTTTFQNGLNPPINLKLKLEQNASLLLCVRYYYYNDSATDTINFNNWQQLIGISSQLKNGSINSSGNFTVTASLVSATLGGPNNKGEGTSVVYTITPRVYGNWTYGFSFGWLYPSTEDCGQDFLLSTGNGTSYVFTGCTAPLSSLYPVNSQGFVNGFLFAEIVGISNITA